VTAVILANAGDVEEETFIAIATEAYRDASNAMDKMKTGQRGNN
jgi:exopolyphosphatase/pppGpp-phosphohydrolase